MNAYHGNKWAHIEGQEEEEQGDTGGATKVKT